MRFNSAIPIRSQTPQEREALRDALPPGTLPPLPPITAIQNQIPVEEYLMIDPEDLRDRIVQFGLQRDNSSHNQFRRVNKREADALKFTFGTIVGNFLVNSIEIKYDPNLTLGTHRGEARCPNKISLSPIHDSEDIYWLGVFIHEATHIWQCITGRHRGGKPKENYDYTYTQLLSLNLKIEEHAEAVQDWFNVSYSIINGKITPHSKSGQTSAQEIWDEILNVFNRDANYGQRLDPWDLHWIIKKYYSPLIMEIRDPCHIPALRAAHCR